MKIQKQPRTVPVLLLLICILLLSGCSRVISRIPETGDPVDPVRPIDELDDHGIPIISISVEDGETITDTKTWKRCGVIVGGSDAAYDGENLGASIRGRGNGSFLDSPLKKPYKIKFDQKINLLGIGQGAARDWLLLAQARETSFLRNFMALRMGQLLSGIRYSSGFLLVEVYLNGEYMGVYQLCEQVEVQGKRIAVTEESDQDEIGFLVELDHYITKASTKNGTFIVEGEPYQIKSDYQTTKQYRFIENYITSVDTALRKGDRQEIEALIDLDSFVDMYLLQEYLKNTDSGWSSFFLYREIGGKLIFGPPWDFDFSMGNDIRFRNGAWDGFDMGEGYDAGYGQDNEWFKAMWKHDWFRELLAKRWYEISDSVIPKMLEEGREIAEVARVAIDANFDKWETLNGSYDDVVNSLMAWLQNRKQWLDENFSQYLRED